MELFLQAYPTATTVWQHNTFPLSELFPIEDQLLSYFYLHAALRICFFLPHHLALYSTQNHPYLLFYGHSHKLTLHVHYGITVWAYLSQTHRPIALRCMHYGITLWAYLSEPLVKDSHKCLSLTEIPRAPSHVITHYRYIRVTERYTETLHVKKMADLVAVYNCITLLTFELSSFRENGVLVLLHFPHCSRWYLSLDA